MRTLARSDTDGDGVLSAAELRAASTPADDAGDAFRLAQCVCSTFGGNSLLCKEKAHLFLEPLVGVVERLLVSGTDGSAVVACVGARRRPRPL